ncbi:hypothetical protein HAX54_035142 [Datura stramonium]|uniref:Uncharacterized protein n=1 Tax=Datura stramonium TaxID=4076 RepID=A0ABS8VFS7_DATST|nr:hypothetical protein [Datura stramonium]
MGADDQNSNLKNHGIEESCHVKETPFPLLNGIAVTVAYNNVYFSSKVSKPLKNLFAGFPFSGDSLEFLFQPLLVQQKWKRQYWLGSHVAKSKN